MEPCEPWETSPEGYGWLDLQQARVKPRSVFDFGTQVFVIPSPLRLPILHKAIVWGSVWLFIFLSFLKRTSCICPEFSQFFSRKLGINQCMVTKWFLTSMHNYVYCQIRYWLLSQRWKIPWMKIFLRHNWPVLKAEAAVPDFLKEYCPKGCS